MRKEDLFACLEKASEAFEKQAAQAAAAQEPDEEELRMMEEELAAQVAAELGLLQPE